MPASRSTGHASFWCLHELLSRPAAQRLGTVLDTRHLSDVRPPTPLAETEREVRLNFLRDQIELMRRYASETDSPQHARWLLKEIIYRAWEYPQIPKPRFDKYSLWFDWSPSAFARLDGYTIGAKRPEIKGLRFEHLIPRGILAGELLEKDSDDLGLFLDDHFKAVVITVDDDRELNRHGMRARMPEGWELGQDPWVRYEAAGLSRGDFVIPCEVRPDLQAPVSPP